MQKKRLIPLAAFGLILVAVACGGTTTTLGGTATPTPSPTASPTSMATATPQPPTPTLTPTLSVTREWDLEEVRLGSGTVRVMVRVLSGIDVQVTLDGRPADEVIASNPPIVEYLFRDVTPGEHTIGVMDVVGFSESVKVKLREPTPTPSLGEKPTAGGLCVPAVPLALSVGDSWVLAGPVRVEGNAAEDIPSGAAKWSASYEVLALDDASLSLGAGEPRSDKAGAVLVENARVELGSTLVFRDADGEVLLTEEETVGGNTIYAAGLSPLLTPDWACHQQAWLQRGTAGSLPGGGEVAAEYTVGEKTLESGVTVALFTQNLDISQPEQGVEMTAETTFGYDKATGRLALVDLRNTGTRQGEPFSLEMVQELVLDSTP